MYVCIENDKVQPSTYYEPLNEILGAKICMRHTECLS